MEAKADEVRLDVRRDMRGMEFLSYAGKPLHNLSSWAGKFYDVMNALGLNRLDMGVEVNGNFNDSYRWVRSSKGIPEGLLHSQVKFILFDVPDLRVGYYERCCYMGMVLLPALQAQGINAVRPEQEYCADEAGVEHAYLLFRSKGLEGAMVKTTTHLYQEGKRTYDWLKLKPEETHDGRITEILRATSIHGEPLDRAGSVRVVLEDGSTADPAGIPHELGRDMFANPAKYIGQWVELKCMERDRQGGYRHPSFVRLREAKE